ncbi:MULTISPECIES: hypothetical protein [Isoptericola]|uniref:Uncharacterized protein n=1 Tax=Isoptericola sediminis TaxID=2733572 RepID=A0A849K8D4_9MICO|nr:MULTISPECIES: hypothetical protein [Isoptericola]MDO8144434.1 hypothetical protein [Isoptericola sp. 178]MDO8148288.1 hypothetical protein [Isoptericola sp. b515]MDO8151769.1 hypothetical protein [Isoptericola sp. b408]NNU28035.1 hypothetical protein [Isoptericola sediminis]
MSTLSAFLKARISELLEHEGKHRGEHGHVPLTPEREAELRELHAHADQYEQGLFGPAQASWAEGLMRESAADFSDHPDYRDEWRP